MAPFLDRARTSALAALAAGSAAALGIAAASPAQAQSVGEQAPAVTTQASTTTAAQQLAEGGIASAIWRYVAAPDRTVGANDWSCKPSAAKPNPVILLPGTFANHGANFVKLGPRLKNAGYCTYALNYGQTYLSLGRVGGLDKITTSAKQLDAFVDRVKRSTGATKVDIVGHSQGGNVPMYWMKRMGGAQETGRYIGWAPSSRGTTLVGLTELARSLRLLGFVVGVSQVAGFPGVTDQIHTSPYTQSLFPNGSADVPAGPKYTVIATTKDLVVTPYQTQLLQGADVNNIVMQDRCPSSKVGHIGLALDSPTMQLTENALADGPKDFQPTCSGFGPVL